MYSSMQCNRSKLITRRRLSSQCTHRGDYSTYIYSTAYSQDIVRIRVYCSRRGGYRFTVHYVTTRGLMQRPYHTILLHRVYYSFTVHQCGVRIAGYCHWRDNFPLRGGGGSCRACSHALVRLQCSEHDMQPQTTMACPG